MKEGGKDIDEATLLARETSGVNKNSSQSQKASPDDNMDPEIPYKDLIQKHEGFEIINEIF